MIVPRVARLKDGLWAGWLVLLYLAACVVRPAHADNITQPISIFRSVSLACTPSPPPAGGVGSAGLVDVLHSARTWYRQL